MKINLRGLAGALLFSLNGFVIFFLLFQDRIVVPLWLQAAGRMHPMILHFPIVILMLAMVLEFFRFKPAYSNQPFYQSFTSNLILVGAVSSAVTVIMGLFLSREPGYSGAALEWHKWTGAGISILSSAIYFSRKNLWYNKRLAKSCALVITVCLLITGHFGATLTHGENFILEPITLAQRVPVNEALVYKDVIKPIFDKKCVSCHNPDKVKGKLLLTDAEGLLKGGKTGKLFVAGKPQLSLLLKRVHLPLEDKKHMPPSGKVQLSEDEITLLYLWIKSKPDFKKKVIDLPADDSLRILASALLKPDEPLEEHYDFAAADENTITKLNSSYRVISPLAKGSPALAVNIYNRNAFHLGLLKELTDIRKQIVFLNLNKMPVRDADLKIIGGFENLVKLNLNFTDITGNGLKELAGLQQLKSLSLTGTKVSFHSLQALSGFRSLQQVAVWNTPLNDSEIRRLKNSNRIHFLTGYKDDGSIVNKLNPPKVKDPVFVFGNADTIELQHSIPNTEIRYTLDGTEPDSLHSALFTRPFVISDATTITARGFKKGWASSNSAVYTFYKSRLKPDSISLLSAPDAMFKGNGAATLVNGRSSNFAFRSEEWVGFKKGGLNALMQFKQPVKVSSVALNLLFNPGGFVYPPARVEVWGGSGKGSMKLLKSIVPERMTKNDTLKLATIKTVVCKFNPSLLTYLKVVAVPQPLPAGFKPEKGKKLPEVLMMINELLIN